MQNKASNYKQLGVDVKLKKGKNIIKINTLEKSEFNNLSVFGISEKS